MSTADVLFSKDPGLHQRGTAIAVLRLRGATFAVAGTHLDLRPEPRLRHVGELHAAIGRHVPADVPAIVAGDINDHPGSAPWQALADARPDAFAAVGAGTAFTSPARGAAPDASTACSPTRGPPRSPPGVLDQPDVADRQRPPSGAGRARTALTARATYAVTGRTVCTRQQPAFERQRAAAGGLRCRRRAAPRTASRPGAATWGRARNAARSSGANSSGSVPVSRHHNAKIKLRVGHWNHLASSVRVAR